MADGRISDLAKYDKSNLISEILGTMISSKRVFNVGSLANLKMHVTARIESINATRRFAAREADNENRSRFGKWPEGNIGFRGEDSSEANRIPNDSDQTLDCNTANRFFTQSGTLAAGGTADFTKEGYQSGIKIEEKVEASDWIPGNGGEE